MAKFLTELWDCLLQQNSYLYQSWNNNSHCNL